MQKIIFFMTISLLAITGTLFFETKIQQEEHYCSICGVLNKSNWYFCFDYQYFKKNNIQETIISKFLYANHLESYKSHIHKWHLIRHNVKGQGCAIGKYKCHWNSINNEDFGYFLQSITKIDKARTPYIAHLILSHPSADDDFLCWDIQKHEQLKEVLKKMMDKRHFRYFMVNEKEVYYIMDCDYYMDLLFSHLKHLESTMK